MTILYILGAYKDWDHDDPKSENYCPKFPFTWAFTTLIVYWILMPTIAIMMCLFAICKSRSKQGATENQPEI